jgi:hypothetical protein
MDQHMAELNALRLSRKAALQTLESELRKLQRLTDDMERLRVTPPRWDAQNAIVRAAQAEFEQADRAYLDALCPPRENRK